MKIYALMREETGEWNWWKIIQKDLSDFLNICVERLFNDIILVKSIFQLNYLIKIKLLIFNRSI